MARNGHDPETATSTPIVYDTGFELERIADALALYAATLSNAGFAETANLIRIARLDLVTRIHGITDEELRSVAALVDFGQSALRYRRQ